jgi:hypothetical protein
MDSALMNPEDVLRKLNAIRLKQQDNVPKGFYCAVELAEKWKISRRQADERLKELLANKKVTRIILKRKFVNGIRSVSYYG